jgi:hypothetical protein
MGDEQENFFDYVLGDLAIGKNKFTEHRKQHSATWMMLNGNVVKMKDMTTSHIEKCMILLERANQTDLLAYTGLSDELKVRESLKALASDQEVLDSITYRSSCLYFES